MLRIGTFRVICLVLCGEGFLSADWANERGNPQSTGAVEQALPENLVLAWSIKLSDAIEATPAIANQKIFVGDFSGKFYAVNLKDGQQLWVKEIPASRAAPAVSGNRVVIGDVDGLLHCLNTETGDSFWKFDTEGVIDSGATIVDERVYIASQAGSLICLDLLNGTETWRYETSDQLRCSPTVATGKVFLGGCDGKLHQVDAKTGMAIGSPFSLDGPTGATPSVFQDRVFVPTLGGVVFAFKLDQAKPLWEYSDENRRQEIRSSAAMTAKTLVVCTQGKQVTAIDLESGKQVWQEVLRRRSDAAPVIAGTSVFVAASDGQLLRFDLGSGKSSWKHEIRGSFLASPAISDQSLIVGTDQGELLCFR
jgi:outer membrane protein assembly factor BamB